LIWAYVPFQKSYCQVARNDEKPNKVRIITLSVRTMYIPAPKERRARLERRPPMIPPIVSSRLVCNLPAQGRAPKVWAAMNHQAGVPQNNEADISETGRSGRANRMLFPANGRANADGETDHHSTDKRASPEGSLFWLHQRRATHQVQFATNHNTFFFTQMIQINSWFRSFRTSKCDTQANYPEIATNSTGNLNFSPRRGEDRTADAKNGERRY